MEIGPAALKEFEVIAANKQHGFLKRDSLAILLFSRKVVLQEITYIHNNPKSKHWRLAEAPEAYRFSSASYYETGIDEFGF